MHKIIIDHIPTRNSEPKYSEYDAPYDHMFEQSELEQNTKDFGFIPRSLFKLYVGPPVKWDDVPDILQAHKLVEASKLSNYLGCCIPVESGLNIKKWRHYLANYWDQQLSEYGFPLDFDRKCSLNSVE